MLGIIFLFVLLFYVFLLGCMTDNSKRKRLDTTHIPRKAKICYRVEFLEEVGNVIHGQYSISKRNRKLQGYRFNLVRYNSKDKAVRYYLNAQKYQALHVPVPHEIYMPKEGPLKDGFFLFFKGHHLTPPSRRLGENNVKDTEESGIVDVVR